MLTLSCLVTTDAISLEVDVYTMNVIQPDSENAGPAESLFKESYYQLMKTALREGGILCCQGDLSVFLCFVVPLH